MNPDGDSEAIDRLVHAFYRAFDNVAAVPTAGAVRDCFDEGARITRFLGTDAESYSVDAFIEPRIALLRGGGLVDFHEWEVTATTETFGGIATRTSRYRKSGVLHGAPYMGGGTKLFQFVKQRAGWRIVSLAWIDDAN